ncbi:uncharacterized protein LOC120511460 [Passer montanus]|uniref:uncharacterized protein LOC120511460 n=1 Tax=Passer montanus TaxID=9160 RepID=UPI0019602EDC|nr:uncharacterized protein LOC120511460 [Passer montanus]XP_039584466.1 uncharacterized protein LOC120511460 [Passer montanus]
MGSLLSRSVEIQISNNTQNITLRNPRTFFDCGRCSKPPLPELFPGSSDICHFPGDFPFWGVAGILVYEADSFTLAIHFSNPIDYKKFSMELGLELSPGRAHLDSLGTTYARMAKGTYSSSCLDIKFTRVVVGSSHGTAQLSHGPVMVMATMSRNTNSTIKVVLTEQRGSGEEGGEEAPQDGVRNRSRRSENLLDFDWDVKENPGRA